MVLGAIKLNSISNKPIHTVSQSVPKYDGWILMLENKRKTIYISEQNAINAEYRIENPQKATTLKNAIESNSAIIVN